MAHSCVGTSGDATMAHSCKKRQACLLAMVGRHGNDPAEPVLRPKGLLLRAEGFVARLGLPQGLQGACVRAGAGSVRDGGGRCGLLAARPGRRWQAAGGGRPDHAHVLLGWPRCVAARHGGHNSCVPRVGWQRWVLSTVVHAAAPGLPPHALGCPPVRTPPRHPAPGRARRQARRVARMETIVVSTEQFRGESPGRSHSPPAAGRLLLGNPRCLGQAAWQDKALTYSI
jgi:hypothetical protein